MALAFPSLGRHCAKVECNQLDFLPFSCPRCHKTFCGDHWRPFDKSTHGTNGNSGHECEVPEHVGEGDNRVHVCPLCDKPVPIKRGEDPNLRMNLHIQNQCQTNPNSTDGTSIYTSRCTFPTCRSKTISPITCHSCGYGFCIKHRIEADHGCKGGRRKGNPGGGGGGGKREGWRVWMNGLVRG